MHPRTIVRLVGYAAMWVLLFTLAAVSIVPKAFGGSGLTILTGSMEPTIHPGDVVAIKPVPYKDLKVGNIITFQPKSGDPMLITHRIIAKSSGGVNRITTKGDANGAADTPIKPEQVKGRFMYRVPWVGHVIQPVNKAMGSNGSIIVGGLLALGLFWLIKDDPNEESGKKNDDEGGSTKVED